MRYLLCFLPPVAVLSTGKLFTFILNLVLTLCGYIPGVIHAFFVVQKRYTDIRHKEVVNAIKSNNVEVA